VPATLRQPREPLPIPIAGASAITTASDGAVWIGTANGLLRLDPRERPENRRRYFAGKRYLPDNKVLALEPDSQGGVWVLTETGVSHLEWRRMTLAEKAAYFEERIRLRHDRHGFVADSRLLTPGDLSTSRTFSNDNDGLWTAMYAAAELLEYATTQSPAALTRARKAATAILHLEEITGIPGLPARSWIAPDEPKPGDGIWFPTADKKNLWKGDTSSDEIVGHFLLFALAWDYLPQDDPIRSRVRATAARIMDHILNNRYHLIDLHGGPTWWGRWSPEYFETTRGRPDAPLNAVELLSFLKVTHHLTGDPKYDREYRKVALDMGYLKVANQYLELRQEINYSDEELAMLSFWPLFLYEKDPQLRQPLLTACDQWWQNIEREKNPLWTYIYKLGRPEANVDLDGARWILERIPMDLVSWDVRNSHRADVVFAPGKDRFRRAEALILLPPDERPVMKWNGNPFVIDGGNGGRSEDDGAFYLLPYWLGRHMGLLRESD
jgi:hypothetical protein